MKIPLPPFARKQIVLFCVFFHKDSKNINLLVGNQPLQKLEPMKLIIEISISQYFSYGRVIESIRHWTFRWRFESHRNQKKKEKRREWLNFEVPMKLQWFDCSKCRHFRCLCWCFFVIIVSASIFIIAHSLG